MRNGVSLFAKLWHMKNITTLSSFFLIGTTISLLMKTWLQPNNLHLDSSEEDYHLYL